MKEILTVSGHACQVDDSDYDDLMLFKWYRKKVGVNIYAQTYWVLPNGKRMWINMHRMLLPKEKEVDHRDNNGLNNQRSNLRACSHSDNMKNRTIRGTSKYRGVCLHLRGRWIAHININGKQKHLGLFDNEIDAAIAYNKAAIATGNEYYVINKI